MWADEVAARQGLGWVGERLRGERLGRGLSLRELARRLDLSPSLISQIETGKANPSVSTLYAIAAELDLSVDALLFADEYEPGAAPEVASQPEAGAAGGALTDQVIHLPSVERAHRRPSVQLGSGIHWERLGSDEALGAEFLYVVYPTGGASSPPGVFQRHAGREWGYIQSGTLGITVEFVDYVLRPGDSIGFSSSLPHRLYTLGDEPVQAVWFVLGTTAGWHEQFAAVRIDGSGAEHDGAVT